MEGEIADMVAHVRAMTQTTCTADEIEQLLRRVALDEREVGRMIEDYFEGAGDLKKLESGWAEVSNKGRKKKVRRGARAPTMYGPITILRGHRLRAGRRRP